MGHMNPYLVGSSRVQSQADIGKIIFVVVGKLCKMGTGIFAVFKICLAHDGRAGKPCDGDCDGSFGGKVSADNCPVSDLYFNVCFDSNNHFVVMYG